MSKRLVTYKYKKGTIKIIKQGGLRKSLWNNRLLKEYVNEKLGLVYGYIGSFERTIKSDRVLMRVQKKLNISDTYLINGFLINSLGRHTADSLELGMSEKQIEKILTNAIRKNM